MGKTWKPVTREWSRRIERVVQAALWGYRATDDEQPEAARAFLTAVTAAK